MEEYEYREKKAGFRMRRNEEELKNSNEYRDIKAKRKN